MILMTAIKFFGWNVGMRKIPFYQLLHHEAGIGLKEAKNIKDNVVNGIEEIIYVEDAISEHILNKSLELGVKTCIL